VPKCLGPPGFRRANDALNPAAYAAGYFLPARRASKARAATRLIQLIACRHTAKLRQLPTAQLRSDSELASGVERMFERDPRVFEVPLSKAYSFMYENFVIATQHELYLLLEKTEGTVRAIKFDFSASKYGSPNDEARGGHPLAKYGLGVYGLYQVAGSPWIRELMAANRVHPRHTDALFADLKHYIACFKDVTLEVVCKEMREITLSVSEVAVIVSQQVDYLETQA